MFRQAQGVLTDIFRSLVTDALRRDKDQSLTLATVNLATPEARALTDFDARQKGIEGVVAPVKESLQRMGEQLDAIEFSRRQAYGVLSTRPESLVQMQGAFWSKTVHVVKPLRVPAFAFDGVRTS